MAEEFSPQLQQILDRFGNELKVYIQNEVKQQVAEQLNGTAVQTAPKNTEPADPLAALDELHNSIIAENDSYDELSLEGLNVQADTVVSAKPIAQQKQPQVQQPSSFDWGNMSDNEKMFALLNKIKSKHATK